MKVRISEPADADLDAILLRIFADRPRSAERMFLRLLTAIEGLKDFPLAGRPTSSGDRELVTVRPYVVQYSVSAGFVDILRIWHGAQDRSSGD